MNEGQLLSEQLTYYPERAAEYDEWFLRQGRYDQGPEHRAQWFGEVALIEAALRKTVPQGDMPEQACGTGLWTRHLAERHTRIVAVDASPEAVAIKSRACTNA